MTIIHADDGCRLHVDSTGQGAETVVLVPGLGGDGRFWADVAAPLERRYRVVSVDHRGAGRSDRPEGAYSIAGLAADMIAVLDRLDLRRAHFVGHSTGGAIVQTLALDHPDRVDRIVLSGTWDKPDHRFRALFHLRLKLLELGLFEEYQELTHMLGYTPDYLAANSRALVEATGRAAEALQPCAVTMARIEMLLRFDRSADLGRIRAPTLVIAATDDTMIPFHHGQALAAAIRGAKLSEAVGGHFFPRVHPQTYVRMLFSFLAGEGHPTARP
ncbi:alpha/beta fold hydrolase [Aureimonas altamirensis]|uniref:alpha/beta fold hydrolase n=1 Tax=Aureimonas altamirensis TaxID=370622 RepID=UPI00255497C1|nr:alpha/beta fold hydrolase [Aureimonas altamirensis]